MQDTLSPKQLAAAIGVSESTMKRWADNGLIQIIRTQGGHRRIPLKECVKLVREKNLGVINPELLGLHKSFSNKKTPDLAEYTYQKLLDGEGQQCKNALIQAYLQGQTLAHLFDSVIRPAMARLGQLWSHDLDGIATEHYATQICIETLIQLRSYLPAPEESHHLALGGSLSGDPYIMPSLMTATIFEQEGFHSKNFGANTPLQLLINKGINEKAHAVWASVSYNPKPKILTRDLLNAANQLSAHGIYLILGGQSLDKKHYANHNYLCYMESMAELAGFVKGIKANKIE